MNIVEQLRQVDWNDPGRWPLVVHAGVVALTFVVLSFAFSFYFVVSDKRPELERKEAEETALRSTFREKHGKAVNLKVYEEQLRDIERSFGALLRQLPGKTEVPNLLVDISIKSEKGAPFDQLTLDLTARTYRYLDDDEVAAGEADRSAKEQKGQKGRKKK